MLDASWYSLRRLNELFESWDHPSSSWTKKDLRQRIITEMVTAESNHRWLLDALSAQREGTFDLIGWNAEVQEIDRTLAHMADHLGSIGMLWPRW